MGLGFREPWKGRNFGEEIDELKERLEKAEEYIEVLKKHVLTVEKKEVDWVNRKH